MAKAHKPHRKSKTAGLAEFDPPTDQGGDGVSPAAGSSGRASAGGDSAGASAIGSARVAASAVVSSASGSSASGSAGGISASVNIGVPAAGSTIMVVVSPSAAGLA